MHLDWIVSPLACYGALALVLAACLFLAFTFKVEIAEVRRRAAQSNESLAMQIQEMGSAMARMRDDVPEAAELPAAFGPSLNLTKRARALRMHVRGESIETIAAALGAPRNEIELLLKLHETLHS
jgi:hypothetical protein